MLFYQILKFAVLMNLCLLNQLSAQQSQNNLVAVQNIYDAIQKKGASTPMSDLVLKIKDYHTNSDRVIFDNYHITLPDILQNYWGQIAVINLQIKEIDGNMVVATGEFVGRQATECEIITTQFQHLWSLKDGNIIEIKEESIKRKS